MRFTTLQPPYFLKPAANLCRVLNITDRWPGEHELEGLGVPQQSRGGDVSEAGASAAAGREVLVTGTVLLAGTGPVLVPTGPGVGPDHRMALELVGPDLPLPGSRVGVHGELRHRSLVVAGWRPEPGSTSTWSADPPSLSGVDPAVSNRIIDSVPDDWRIISVGQAKTPGGAMVVDIEVEEATAEIREWLARQPPESVRMIAFIVDMASDQ